MAANPTTQILALIESFPCLKKKLAGWSPKEFDADVFYKMMDGWSHGEFLCGVFILNVWNPGHARANQWNFDAIEFAGTCDSENRRAFIQWMANPIWP